MSVRAGTPPPGSTRDGSGFHFALAAPDADKVELCLFDEGGGSERRVLLDERDGALRHGYVPGLAPGQLYGYRVHGPYRPSDGHRFNPHKLLIDPYAANLHGRMQWHDAVFGYQRGHPAGDLTFDDRDSAAYVPRCVAGAAFADPAFCAPRPQTPWADTIIYELHLKGVTALHPDIGPGLRGTAAALAHPEMLAHLTSLGVTAVELMPVTAWVSEEALLARGLTNYWGYNPISFFAPDTEHLGLRSLDDLAEAVDALHRGGIEVILDLVFNHTAESHAGGPTLCWRGIANRDYYVLDPDDQRRYLDWSGCGNALDATSPLTQRLITDSLHHWVRVTNVDGFRLDLAGELRRGQGAADFLDGLAHDPVLVDRKLIAEPWDATGEGYALGHFGDGWAEWNDKFRSSARRFWAGHRDTAPEMATRLAGSSDVFNERAPYGSVNFITAHDGFTLTDLTSYNHRHNEANGEGNRDGDQHADYIAIGPEGPSGDPAVLTSRLTARRNLLATLLLACGVPMLRAGDEIGHSQGGNNNAYCQDNETSWLDWSGRDDELRDLRGFIGELARLRRTLPALDGPCEIDWLTPDGHAMTRADWDFADAHMLICRKVPDTTGASVLIVLNAFDGIVDMRLPQTGSSATDWVCRLATSAAGVGASSTPTWGVGENVSVAGHSVLLFETAPDTLPPDLVQRAGEQGVATEYDRIGGERQAPSAESILRIIETLEAGDGTTTSCPLPDDPGPAFLPDALKDGGRRWGVSLQLYGLRSRHNWGMGDFSDLAALARQAAAAGADAMMINPLHALYRCYPEQASPYAPSSRLFLNPLYIDVAQVPEMAECRAAKALMTAPDFLAKLEQLRATEHVDYTGVSECKFAVLKLLYETFCKRHLGRGTARGAAFAEFRDMGGDTLQRFCIFEALHETLHGSHPDGWPGWPENLRDPAAPGIAAFEAASGTEIGFAAYLQWVARTQLESAALAARAGGMAIGLVADIAIGADGAGADVWADQALVARDMELGAPPDPFAPDGQTWGAPPWRPNVLAARGLAPFRALLDATMGWAGGVRIDHVIGLERQFWVPGGFGGRDGSYVAFPRDALFSEACAASRAHECLIIGEDLGTVPDGFRNRMRARHMLTTSVMRFERRHGAFIPPGSYPSLSAACAGTHDLVPLAGYATGTDIASRAMAAPGSEDVAAARDGRAADVAALMAALADEGLGGAGRLKDAVHRFLARTPSALVFAQLEDLLGVDVQPNLPGTVDGHPNWRRKYPMTLEQMAEDAKLALTGDLFTSEGRGR